MRQDVKESASEFQWIGVVFLFTFPIFVIIGLLGGFDF
tara:strand:- start:394 stop:507 length:114 start_codon:yes stop_codon:yes gene_type:complete